MLNVYYNLEGAGDVLFVTVNGDEIQERDYKQTGDVVRIYDRQNDATFGYNVFNASNHFTIDGNGIIEVTESLVESINRVLDENGFESSLEFDPRPLFIVGYVETKEKHPDADKLSVCKVNIGDEVLQIVCGAPNVEEGQKVVVARVGAVMPSGMLIKEAELRGVPSSGMICSAKELELPDAPKEKGILVLDGTYEIGSEFR